MTFWATFALSASAALVGVLIGGSILTWGALGRINRMLDRAADDILDVSYKQIGGLRDQAKTLVDEAVERLESSGAAHVERIDAAAAEQHDQTRRVLEHRTAYTGSQEIPLPTAADGQAAADAWRRAQQRVAADPHARRVDPRAAGHAPPTPPPPGYRPQTLLDRAAPQPPSRPQTSAALIGDQLAAQVVAARRDAAARTAAQPAPDPRPEPRGDGIDRDPRRPPRHRQHDDR